MSCGSRNGASTTALTAAAQEEAPVEEFRQQQHERQISDQLELQLRRRLQRLEEHPLLRFRRQGAPPRRHLQGFRAMRAAANAAKTQKIYACVGLVHQAHVAEGQPGKNL